MITGTEDRQHVALTRGTTANIAYVVTVPPKRADPAPGPRRPRSWPATTQIYAERSSDPAPATLPRPATLNTNRQSDRDSVDCVAMAAHRTII